MRGDLIYLDIGNMYSFSLLLIKIITSYLQSTKPLLYHYQMLPKKMWTRKTLQRLKIRIRLSQMRNQWLRIKKTKRLPKENKRLPMKMIQRIKRRPKRRKNVQNVVAASVKFLFPPTV